MEVLSQTQFAKLSPKFHKLPPFLAKKLEEAIVKAATKQPTKAQLEEKLKKAELLRQEKLSQRTIKLAQQQNRFEEAQRRQVDQYEVRSNYYEDRLTYKHTLAASRIQMEKERIIKKCKEMGTEAAIRAQQRKSELEKEQDMFKAKWAHFTEARFQERVESAEAAKKEIVRKNKDRNYEILKKMNRQRFAGILEHQAKKQSLEAKLAKAEELRKQQLKEKIDKAKALYDAARFVSNEVEQPAAEKIMVKFEESKTVESQSVNSELSEKKAVETQTPRSVVKPNENLVKGPGFSEGKNRKNAIVKPNAVGWTISRRSKLANQDQDPQTDSDSDEKEWEKI